LRKNYLSLGTGCLGLRVNLKSLGSPADSDERGGLNGLTQYLLEVHVQESAKLNSLNGIDSNGTLLCLGSDWFLPYWLTLDGKYHQANRLKDVASTG
jgi:hypothetical protein